MGLQANEYSYPWLDSANFAGDNFVTTEDEVFDLSPGGALNPIENLNLMVASGVCTFKMFRCPSISSDIAPRDDDSGNEKYGFKARNSAGTFEVWVDYGMHDGYRTLDGDNEPNPAKLTESANGLLGFLADQPGGNLTEFERISNDDGTNTGADMNHGDDGINLLNASGSVAWKTEILSGISDDNIYTAATADADGELTGNTDSVDSPVCEDDTVIYSVPQP